MTDLIRVLPNIYICNFNCNKLDDVFAQNSITNVININGYKVNTKNYNTLNITIDKNNQYLMLGNNAITTGKDIYYIANDFIINTIKNKQNVVICDENFNNPFLITLVFCTRILRLPFTYSIYYLQRISDVDISSISEHELFNTFQLATQLATQLTT